MYKIVIWGHKYNNHTHGHIHSSYYKVFKYLGYDTHWFDDNEDVSNFNFDNCIFLTEDQAQKNIPLNKTCKYILHHTNLDKYNANGLTYINLANYLKLCNEGVSAYHKENKVVKIAELCYWDEVTKTIYQPWATDLTPDEINIESAIKGNVNEKNIYYIGTSHDNTKQLTEFNSTAIANGKQLIVGKTNTDKENLDLIRQSYLSVDIRGDWHVECGYLPCRVFKNISYGRITGTNSKHVKEVLGEHVVYDENPAELFNKLVEAEQNQSIDDIKNAMTFIKENHTFVNRINNIIKCFEL
jgi:hypothetical protein